MKRNVQAFSLIELLVVMAVMAIVLAFSVPALNSVLAGSNLARSGQIVGDAFNLARQEATSKNHDMTVRFWKSPSEIDATPRWRAVQIWENKTDPSGVSSPMPASRLFMFPNNIIIDDSASLSPLLSVAPETGRGTLPGRAGQEFDYCGFRFRPTGEMDSAIPSTANFLTLRDERDATSPPVNYYTLQVVPLTGKVIIYRPEP